MIVTPFILDELILYNFLGEANEAKDLSLEKKRSFLEAYFTRYVVFFPFLENNI